MTVKKRIYHKIRKTKVQLLAEKNYLSALLACIPVGIIVTNQKNELIYVADGFVSDTTAFSSEPMC